VAQGKRRKIDTLGQGGVGNALLLQGVQFASRVPLFSTLAPSELPLVAGAFSVVEYKEDEVIIRQGDPGRELFIIESGRVGVSVQWPWLEDPVRVRELEEGSYFGEDALLSGAPRSASLVALEDCKLWVLERSDFENLGLRHRLHFRKRQAVHMGSTDEENSQTEYPEDSNEKTDAQRELLRAAMKKNENVGEADVDAVVESARPLEVESGMEIMTQGDTKLVLFYIVEEGSFEVFRDGNSISRLGRGQSFGELALLVLEPCAATVRATTASKLWVIPRQTLREIRKAPLRQRVEEYVKVLGKAQQLQDACRARLADVLTEMTFSKDEYIIRQGEEVRSFFVLYDGRVSMDVAGQKESSQELCGDPSSGATEFFGERALMGDEISPASVRCVSDRVVVLALERQDFLRVTCSQQEATKAGTDNGGNLMEYSLDGLQEVALLGCGSYARVSLQRDRETGRTFALKALSKGRILQRRQVRQVQTERLVLKTTDSPFLIRLAATFSGLSHLYFLLEFAVGGELSTVCERHELFHSPRHARFYVACALEGLVHLHERSVVYRDLKLENMLVDGEGYCKLADFGLSKFVVGHTYTLCGTPDYMAPEMLSGAGHTRAVDWWALGVTTCALMTGVLPFDAPTAPQIFEKVKRGVEHTLRSAGFGGGCGAGAWADLVRGLCREEASARLPVRPGGASNVRQHSWFKDVGFDWEQLGSRSMNPPYMPCLIGPEDLANFDPNPEDTPVDVRYFDPGDGWDNEFADSWGPRRFAA
jgi:cGMP-dependent protein kinase